MDGMRIAQGALGAGANSLNVTANNLANVNTDGFRSDDVHFQTGPAGQGVEIGAVTANTNQGPTAFTGRSMDLAATGDSFFVVRQSNGRLAFTQDGSFQIDARGRVADSRGNLLDPSITVPSDATGVSVGRDGKVTATTSEGKSVEVGNVQTVRFSNSSGLSNIGENLNLATPASGAAMRNGGGEILQGALSLSNTDIAKEMVNLIRDERYTQFNAKVVRTEDEMQGTILDLKR